MGSQGGLTFVWQAIVYYVGRYYLQLPEIGSFYIEFDIDEPINLSSLNSISSGLSIYSYHFKS